MSPLRHGHSVGGESKEYRTWINIRQRCMNKNHPRYHQYGGRGVKLCDRWMVFENFFADMGPKPEGMTIERIDVNKGYEPGNCRWASYLEQARNKSNTVWFEKDGVRKSSHEWALELGIRPGTVRMRISDGWDLERAIFEPVAKKFAKNRPGEYNARHPLVG